MSKEEQILSASIIRSRAEAYKSEADVSRTIESYSGSHDAEEYEERRSEKEEILQWYIENMIQEGAILAERLFLPMFSKRLWKKFEEVKREGVNMTPTPYDIGLVSESFSEARRLTAPLLDMVGATAVSGLSVFETILKNTAAIINDLNVDPTKESDVRREIFKVLKYAIPDTQREITINHISKNYKMDFGARSVAAAAEYKYADSEEELKTSIESVYADMKGYRGDYDFRSFYAVFYLTSPITNIDRVEAEFRHVGVGIEWKPIVVCGRGGRDKHANG